MLSIMIMITLVIVAVIVLPNQRQRHAQRSEFQHGVLLTLAIAVSLAVSVWRSVHTRRLWPVAVATVGATLVLMGHLLGELHALEWTGVVVLLVGGPTEHIRLRGVAAQALRANA